VFFLVLPETCSFMPFGYRGLRTCYKGYVLLRNPSPDFARRPTHGARLLGLFLFAFSVLCVASGPVGKKVAAHFLAVAKLVY
jgi:hypothetical protein